MRNKMIKQFTAFRTSDNKTFDNKGEAEAWERSGRFLELMRNFNNETSASRNPDAVREYLFNNWKQIKAIVTAPLEERLPPEATK